ncbi:MAG: 16S rRNA (cytosine(1402)-N(4))-methyltransferase RsmH [Bacillota bacterium]|nr:16S rRNA (cytosine(1402)-N(4))-methyltransferase RsmH [Bacillota bacterium]
MEFKHTSVLLAEVIENLRIFPGGVYVDGTLGGGGHGAGICRRLDQKGLLIGIDRDGDALKAAAERLRFYECEKRLIKGEYADIKEILEREGVERIDGALLDLGVSSFQLDSPDRGFSYMQDGPLDMRMDGEGDLTAAEVVNGYSEEALAGVIRNFGEERWASRISRFIAEERKREPILTTGRLVDIIKAAIPASARREGPHPAKRTFQALRIEVNDELGQLERALDDFMDVLAPGGRLCVITFHSLEDRIVKEKFQRRLDPCDCPKDLPVCVCGKAADVRKVTGKPILPTETETEENPRARSAKLRVIEKKASEEE